MGSLTEAVARLAAIACFAVEARRFDDCSFGRHSLLAGTATLWRSVLVDTAIVWPLELTKKPC